MGKVATYGQIASLVDASGARQVGYALSSTPDAIDIPWHRVINAKGEISLRADGDCDSEQRQRLMVEGVVPNKNGKINLSTYRWSPTDDDWFDDPSEDAEHWDDKAWDDRPGFG